MGPKKDQLPASYNPSLHFFGERWFLTKPSGDNGRISVIKSGAYIIYRLQTMVIGNIIQGASFSLSIQWGYNELIPHSAKTIPEIDLGQKNLACLVWAYWHWFAVEWSLVEGTQCGIIIIRPSSRIPIHPLVYEIGNTGRLPSLQGWCLES